MDNKKKLDELKIEHGELMVKFRTLLDERKKLNDEWAKEAKKHYTEVDLEKLTSLSGQASAKLGEIFKLQDDIDHCIKTAKELKSKEEG